MRYDFVLIGAGISGMSASLILARHGYRVALVESFPKPAPTLRGFMREGVFFDTGLHYLGSYGEHEILDTYFNYLGIKDIDRVPYDNQGFDRLRFADTGRTFDLPFGYERLRTYLTECFPKEAAGIASYLDAVREDFASSPFLNPEHSFSLESLTSIPSDRSLAEVLDPLTTDPLLGAILSMHSLLYGVSPQETPFSNHAKIVGSYYQSVHGIRGGGITLVRGFEKALKKAGVELMCGNGAREIILSPAGDIQAVRLERGGVLETSQIICTAHPKMLLDLVPPDVFRPIYRRRLATLEDTPSACMLFGIADQPIGSLEHRNMFACHDTDVPSFFDTHRRPEQGPFYIASSTPSDPAGPRGVVAIAPGSMQDFAPWKDSRTGKRPPGYRDRKKRCLDAMWEELVTLCPELSGIRIVDGATPLTVRDYTHSPTGSLYGARHSIHQFNPVPATRLQGLLLAGQSIVAPGILGAIISAFLTCGFIVGHNTLREELIACA
ncbi:phytoene desaturase family protein [Desulfoplanes sp.]